jgi:hypothetical protein
MQQQEGARTRARTFLVLDLGLDVVDGVAALDLESDGLPRQRLHEDLHVGRPWVFFLPSSCAAAAATRWNLYVVVPCRLVRVW